MKQFFLIVTLSVGMIYWVVNHTTPSYQDLDLSETEKEILAMQKQYEGWDEWGTEDYWIKNTVQINTGSTDIDPKVIVHHTVVYNKDLHKIVRAINNVHKKRWLNGVKEWYVSEPILWKVNWVQTSYPYVMYHFIIGRDWDILQNRWTDQIWWWTKYHNQHIDWTPKIHIALVWNLNEHEPTQEQLSSLKKILDNINQQSIKGHWEYADERTACMSRTQSKFRPKRSQYLDTINWGTKQKSWFSIWTATNEKWHTQVQKKVAQHKNQNGWIRVLLSRYYSPMPWQSAYFKWSYEADKAINCWPWSCLDTANGTVLDNSMISKTFACRPEIKWKKVRLTFHRWSIEWYCNDVWSAIVQWRIDNRCGIADVWYYNIKNMSNTCPTWEAVLTIIK